MLEKFERDFDLFVVQPEPLPPKELLPTMYDLPSEDPEEPGLADEFHDLQPQLLSQTLRITDYSADRIFTGTDLNLYYDARHPLWHKRPDWFLALDVPRMYENRDLRSSYVIWQEEVSPFIVVELLSPGTAKEDLGSYAEGIEEEERLETIEPAYGNELPPRKWTVYEKILQVPHYIVFGRFADRPRYFKLINRKYREQPLDPDNPRIWIPELGIGLGVWEGTFEGIARRKWLRWYDADEQWIPTYVERTEQQRQRAEEERQRAEDEFRRAEEERQRAEEEFRRAEDERQRAEEEFRRAEDERQRAEDERQRAEDERQRAEDERQRAEDEFRRAEEERQRAEEAEERLNQVVTSLLRSGMAIAQISQITGLTEAQIRQLEP